MGRDHVQVIFIFLAVLTKAWSLSTWPRENTFGKRLRKWRLSMPVLRMERRGRRMAEVETGCYWAADRCLNKLAVEEGGCCGLRSWCPPGTLLHSQGPSKAEAMKLCSPPRLGTSLACKCTWCSNSGSTSHCVNCLKKNITPPETMMRWQTPNGKRKDLN